MTRGICKAMATFTSVLNSISALFTDVQTLEDNQDDIAVPSTADVFIVAGQSNGVSNAQYLPPVTSETGRVYVSDLDNDFLEVIRAKQVERSCAWVYAGDIYSRAANKPVVFINTAVGNSSSQDWRDTHHTKIADALAAWPQAKAILWFQGESDAALGTSLAVTEANYRWLISTYNQVPWVMGRSGLIGARRPSIASNIIIQEGTALRGPHFLDIRENSRYRNLPSILSIYNEDPTKMFEFYGEDIRAVGTRWGASLVHHFLDDDRVE